MSFANNVSQHNAPTTSAPVPYPASTSRTTAPAHGRTSKTKSNSVMVSRFVEAKEDGTLASSAGRSNWQGRGCYKRVMRWLCHKRVYAVEDGDIMAGHRELMSRGYYGISMTGTGIHIGREGHARSLKTGQVGQVMNSLIRKNTNNAFAMQ